jgi:DNA-binding CsgD family transcriptional regulator
MGLQENGPATIKILFLPAMNAYKSAFQFVSSKMLSAHYPTSRIETMDQDILSMLHFTESLMPGHVIMLCERSATPKVQYVSPGCKNILGYEAWVIKQMPLDKFLDLIHPDDIQHVLQCFSFINQFEPYDPLQYRFDLRYRIRHKNGEYLHVSNEKMTLASQKGTYLYLATLRIISSEEKFHEVKLSVFRNLSGIYKKTRTYHPRQGLRSFTPRQREMVNLIHRGLTNQEIASALNISVHTVKNHKNILFRKANVKSSIELASVAEHL